MHSDYDACQEYLNAFKKSYNKVGRELFQVSIRETGSVSFKNNYVALNFEDL